MYWAQALAEQTEDTELQAAFAGVAKALTENEAKIVAELAPFKASRSTSGATTIPMKSSSRKAMRPSATLNDALESLSPALT